MRAGSKITIKETRFVTTLAFIEGFQSSSDMPFCETSYADSAEGTDYVDLVGNEKYLQVGP